MFNLHWRNFIEHVKIFICCETLHRYLNENSKIHMISGFGYKVMRFRDLSKIHAIASKSSKSNHQQLETYCVPFSHKIFNICTHTQSCNENKWPFVLFVELAITEFCKIAWLFYFILSLLYMMQLSLFIMFIYIT